MDRAQLLAELADASAQPGESVFIERRGEDYLWSLLPPGEVLTLPVYEQATHEPAHGQAPDGQGTYGQPGPDAWIVYSGTWPETRTGPFLEDLLAEMESMCGGADRCRWPLDEPYPRGH